MRLSVEARINAATVCCVLEVAVRTKLPLAAAPAFSSRYYCHVVNIAKAFASPVLSARLLDTKQKILVLYER